MSRLIALFVLIFKVFEIIFAKNSHSILAKPRCGASGATVVRRRVRYQV